MGAGKEYEFVFEMDGDFYDPEDIRASSRRLRTPTRTGHTLQGRIAINWPLTRLILSLVHKYVQWITGMPFSDPTGFNAFGARWRPSISSRFG